MLAITGLDRSEESVILNATSVTGFHTGLVESLTENPDCRRGTCVTTVLLKSVVMHFKMITDVRVKAALMSN